MFIHHAQCPVWVHDETGCSCPREWRIRKNRDPRNDRERDYPWMVFRRLDDGTYTDTPMVSARSHLKAVEIITTLIQVARRFPVLHANG